ncbi:MAG: hypothetical protein IPI32_10110 [Austwickia sp.]|nr:hypothetical protein [Austwickia sp.]
MSDISVNLDPRLLSPLRVMELSALAAGSMPTRPALDDPVAAVSSVPPAPIAADPRQGASPPTMTLAVPPSPERLRPDALTAHATASSLQTRQTSYAEIDRTLAATSSALRRVDSPVDVPRTLTDLTARLETRRGEEAQAIGLAVNRVNELTDQIAHADARDAASSPERAAASAADPLYRRDVALQTLAKLTGAQATPGSGGAPQEPLNVSVHGVPLIADGVPVRLGLGSDATGRLVVTTGDGTVLPMDSGVIGGRLQLANEVLPQVIRGVFALSAVIGGVQADDAGAAASASASALEAVAAQARAGKAAPAVAAFLDAVRTGSVLQPTASLVSGYLGAIDPGEGARQAAQISSLQQINQVTARLGTAADAVASAVASNAATLVQSSAPQVASGEVVGPTVPGSVSFAVLSAASAAAVVSELEFVPDRPLGGGQPFSFGLLTSDDKGTPTHTVFEMMPPAGIADVVAAINRSGTQVRATLSNLGSGAMQLNLVSLSTGRFSSVVVTNAQQPPVSSMVLGRFTRLMDARDTVLRVDSGPSRHPRRIHEPAGVRPDGGRDGIGAAGRPDEGGHVDDHTGPPGPGQ